MLQCNTSFKALGCCNPALLLGLGVLLSPRTHRRASFFLSFAKTEGRPKKKGAKKKGRRKIGPPHAISIRIVRIANALQNIQENSGRQTGCLEQAWCRRTLKTSEPVNAQIPHPHAQYQIISMSSIHQPVSSLAVSWCKYGKHISASDS